LPITIAIYHFFCNFADDMAEKSIVTGQYVRICQTPASVGERMLAQLIDWAVQAGYVALWIYLDIHLGTLLVILLVVLPALLYGLLCELFTGGQTIGKWIVKLRVIMADGTLPSLSAYLLRWLLMMVDGPMLGCVGVLVMILNRNNQRFGDMAAGTLVVKLRSYSKIQVSLDEYDYLTKDYRPSYPQASDLSLEQIDVICRTLDGDVEDRICQLSQKVQQLLGVERRETNDENFLRRIVRDYQYYALEEI
jgi:uncharacterized RDD family membrane protein YckC